MFCLITDRELIYSLEYFINEGNTVVYNTGNLLIFFFFLLETPATADGLPNNSV